MTPSLRLAYASIIAVCVYGMTCVLLNHVNGSDCPVNFVRETKVIFSCDDDTK